MNALLKQLDDEPNLIGVRRWIDAKMAAEAQRRQEFLDWLDETKKAEFINGEVVVHSPERWGHGVPVDNLKLLLIPFVRRNKLGAVADNKLVRFPRNDYIPDLCFWPTQVAETFDDETTVFPPPTLAVEVLSKSSRENDRGVKFEDYAANGVTEYWLIDPADQTIEQYARIDDELGGHYLPNAKASGEEEVVSLAISGLRFPAAAVFDPAVNERVVASMKGQ